MTKAQGGALSVSPMGFGTWAWGNQLLLGYQESMDSELQEVFNLAVDNGINLFDTADSYGTGKLNGKSEKLLGKFIREFQGEKGKDIAIATKFAAYPWRLTPRQFVNVCNASLDRMQIEQIGIEQLHWSTANYNPLQARALWDGLVAMYDKGLVQAVEVRNYGPKQLLKIYEYLKARGVPLCSAQGSATETHTLLDDTSAKPQHQMQCRLCIKSKHKPPSFHATTPQNNSEHFHPN